MPLIKLPNGSWIDPQTIIAIRPLPTEVDLISNTHRARVVIHTVASIEVITANDDEHAQQLADEYAAQCNPQ